MNLLVPTHQFEIRYTHLLDFSNIMREVLAGFVPLATNLKIENENLASARYTLFFEKEHYSILITWDRIVLKYEGDLDALSNSNSIIEEPYLNILSKIRESKNFGALTNVLFYAMYINILDTKETEKVVVDFSKKYLNESRTNMVLNESNDIAIILENKILSKSTSITFGPYLGVQDLQKKNIMPETKKIVDNFEKIGEMAELKIWEPVTKINFFKYKELMKDANNIINELWQ